MGRGRYMGTITYCRKRYQQKQHIINKLKERGGWWCCTIPVDGGYKGYACVDRL